MEHLMQPPKRENFPPKMLQNVTELAHARTHKHKHLINTFTFNLIKKKGRK